MQWITGRLDSRDWMASVLLQGRIAVVLAWAVLAAGCSGEPIDLVLDGVAAVPIVIPDNAVASVQQAAQELQYHVEQASGARLTIYSESGKPKTASGSIYLGNCQATGQAGISLEKLARNTVIKASRVKRPPRSAGQSRSAATWECVPDLRATPRSPSNGRCICRHRLQYLAYSVIPPI